MLMSATTKEEKQDIYRRFDGMITGKGKEIKLCYVTVRNVSSRLRHIIMPIGWSADMHVPA